MKRIAIFVLFLALTRVGVAMGASGAPVGIGNFFLGPPTITDSNLNQVLGLLVGPEGKPGAAGIAGAFIAGDAILIEWLLQRARTYIFTTASPPLLASALLAAIQLIQTENWRQQHLQQLISRFRDGMANLPWPLLPSATAVQALIIKDNQLALDLMEGLREQGIWVPAIRPPTVPKNMARLRISLSAMHSNFQVDQLIKALHRLAKTHANAEIITRNTVE
jgi:8-amino-7-oxononanoate synthase